MAICPELGASFLSYFIETAQSVKDKHFVNLTPLTAGMHGYSLLRPGLNQEYYHELFERSRDFGIPIEGHHTETGESS
jgi:glutamine synthetase